MARKPKKPKRETIKIQIDITRDGVVVLPPALRALPCENTELGEERIDAALAAAAEQYAKGGERVSLGMLYAALQHVGHRLQQPFLLEGIKRLLEFCLRQTGTRAMDRYRLALAVKQQLENTPLEVRKKSKQLLQILSEDERKLFLSKKLILPLSEGSLLWVIVSRIAYAKNLPCAAEPATMFDGYKAGKREWELLSRGENG